MCAVRAAKEMAEELERLYKTWRRCGDGGRAKSHTATASKGLPEPDLAKALELATRKGGRYCLITVPSRRRMTPQPPLSAPRWPSMRNGYLAASFSSTSMPQPGESLA